MKSKAGISKDKFKKAAAVIIALMMIVVVLFSSFIIAVKAEHDCEGEDCHICECIETCIGILNRLGFKLSSSAASSAAAFVPVMTLFLMVSVLTRETPVTSKVRLNN